MKVFETKDKYDINDYREIIKILREPGGCPWDAEQTHESIRRNMIEEAYEAATAIDTGDTENLKEELGDVLMQVLTHAQIEEEAGGFNLDDIADVSVKKLIFRHPHVFGEVEASNADEALDRWEEVKRIEKSQKTVTDSLIGVAEGLPALWRAEKIQGKANKVGFDFENVQGATDKLHEEIGELEEAMASQKQDDIAEELGDVLFAACKVARFLGVDPEQALHKTCEKFISRFSYVEAEAAKMGVELQEMSKEEMNVIYLRSKSAQKE